MTEKTALQYMRDIRKEYNLKAARKVSLKAYCKYFMYDKEDVLQALETRKDKTTG